jgi:hypothetical protein
VPPRRARARGERDAYGEQERERRFHLRFHVIAMKAMYVIAPVVIPAKAGIHVARPGMDSRFRGNDG